MQSFNFRRKGEQIVMRCIEIGEIDSRLCYITSKNGGWKTGCLIEHCEITDEPEWATMFVRLLNYKDACKVVDFSNSVCEDSSNITVGGVRITAPQEIWEKVIAFIETLNSRYELSVEHPTEITKRIIESFKKSV